MGIDKRKCRVRPKRDPLSGRLQGRAESGLLSAERRSHRQDSVEIEMTRRDFGETLEPRRQVSMLARLNEAEMALRQHQRFVARDGAEHRDAERLERIRD